MVSQINRPILMAKLKDKDVRPIRTFQVGDIVEPHGKRTDLIHLNKGIVLEITIQYKVGPTKPYQVLTIYFGDEQSCMDAAKTFARSRIFNKKTTIPGMSLPAEDVFWTNENKAEWLVRPTISEASLNRFKAIKKAIEDE